MTTNYDAPTTDAPSATGTAVRTDGPGRPHSLERTPQRPGAPVVDAEEIAAADSFDLPGADLSSEEISVEILSAQADEFTCASCFLVRHRSQIALDRDGQLYCSDCEG